MRQPIVEIEVFKKRRAELAKKVDGSAMILVANTELIRNHDVSYAFRQDSNFFYLTGFEEPDAVFVFRPGHNPETTLFVRPKDPKMETWDGYRFGPEGAKNDFGMDQAFNLSEIDQKLPDLLKDVDKIYYRVSQHPEFDRKLEHVLDDVRRSFGRSGKGLLPIEDYWEVLGEQRVHKTDAEIHWLQKACELSCEAHMNAMKFSKPGVTERQVQAVLEYTFRMGGAAREGYIPIVAAGNNATTLHYNFNDQVCNDEDLLLIDAGTEWNYYSADITRTFPVNGKFTSVQKDVYQAVLEIQKQAVEMVKPGVTFKELQNHVVDGLTEYMISMGILKGSKNELIEKNEYKKYYPHNIGHFLGLDVHDLGLYVSGKEPRGFEPGMCLTVEPGLYIPHDDQSVPEHYRGIGIRIEDDILVTDSGHLNLTSKAVKEVGEIELVVGSGFTRELLPSKS